MSMVIDRLIYISFYLYIIAVIAVVFFPIPLYFVNVEEGFSLSRYFNFIPFQSIITALDRTPIQPIGNFLLLLPFGIFYPIIKKQIIFKKVLIWGFIISLSIETIQLIISYSIGVPFRIWDVDDLILNTTGASMGYLLFIISLPYVKSTGIDSKLVNNAQSVGLQKWIYGLFTDKQTFP